MYNLLVLFERIYSTGVVARSWGKISLLVINRFMSFARRENSLRLSLNGSGVQLVVRRSAIGRRLAYKSSFPAVKIGSPRTLSLCRHRFQSMMNSDVLCKSSRDKHLFSPRVIQNAYSGYLYIATQL